jgi:hypothetical protein
MGSRSSTPQHLPQEEGEGGRSLVAALRRERTLGLMIQEALDVTHVDGHDRDMLYELQEALDPAAVGLFGLRCVGPGPEYTTQVIQSGVGSSGVCDSHPTRLIPRAGRGNHQMRGAQPGRFMPDRIEPVRAHRESMSPPRAQDVPDSGHTSR